MAGVKIDYNMDTLDEKPSFVEQYSANTDDAFGSEDDC